MGADTDPLTNLEYEAVISAMRHVFANGKCSMSNYTSDDPRDLLAHQDLPVENLQERTKRCQKLL
ncbi:MAG: hypothetical protein J0I00_00145 [Burkholderiales bacterium]|uniref:Uncharacterized protein n=1 Tax=Ottowia pentelensis TaxID=511108 RepID=A0ABV6PPN0_9BURK|nr:hypothetical protein [Ottowia sp.]MBN9403813.1 hypothetical protein [Burkholderiales bacterium]MBS0403215.1 hypothetical protein [Pseudomonadota bacterium]MBS0415030.1 hypothetical protein [Pseudomonadota bacterium]